MSTVPGSGRRDRHDDLADRVARRQQERARAPLRRVGGQRADDRVGGGRRRDGPGRARPRPLDVPGAGQARGRARGRLGLDTGHPMFVISHELPDWASFIAANLVVDGVLTTFVASARDSSIEPLAQRARKILQEEGAHRVHAEAWARRIARRRRGGPASCSAGGSTRCGRRRRAGPGRTRTPATEQAIAERDGERGPARDPRPCARLAHARWSPGLSLDEPDGLVGLGRRSTADDLPVLRLAGRRARSRLGRPDDHEPDALPGAATPYFEAIRDEFGGGIRLRRSWSRPDPSGRSSAASAANQSRIPWTTSSADDR